MPTTGALRSATRLRWLGRLIGLRGSSTLLELSEWIAGISAPKVALLRGLSLVPASRWMWAGPEPVELRPGTIVGVVINDVCAKAVIERASLGDTVADDAWAAAC